MCEGSLGHMLLWVNSVPVVCWHKRTRTKQKHGQVCFSAKAKSESVTWQSKISANWTAEKNICGLLSFHRAFLHICTRKVITVTNYFIILFCLFFLKFFLFNCIMWTYTHTDIRTHIPHMNTALSSLHTCCSCAKCQSDPLCICLDYNLKIILQTEDWGMRVLQSTCGWLMSVGCSPCCGVRGQVQLPPTPATSWKTWTSLT